MTTLKEAPLWRYEIKSGPEGEANYAWVYDADGNMVCTAKTHHAEAIVARMNTTASLQGEDAVERVARIIDPSAWAVMDGYLADTTRKYRGQNVGWPADQFQDKASMGKARAILATGLVPDDPRTTLLTVITDIREKTGLGAKPMLSELADAIATEMDKRVADEREKCAKVAEELRATTYDLGVHAFNIAAAIRREA